MNKCEYYRTSLSRVQITLQMSTNISVFCTSENQFDWFSNVAHGQKCLLFSQDHKRGARLSM